MYVPGEENQIADKKSRVFQDSLEWMLHPAVFQALQKEVGCFGIDLFATRVNHQVPAFVSWRPEPGAVVTDAFNVKWDFNLLYDQKVPQENSARSVTLCPDHTSVEKQSLVSSHSISVGRATIASSKMAGSSETSRHKKDTSPVPSKKLQAGCMAHFRAKLTKEGFSQNVSDIQLSSWRKKTASQYESTWKAWSGWCSEREINPFSTTLENILEFLTDLFYKGSKFRTLGMYKSAISSNHETVDGFVIGKHPMMVKFMKGVFSLRPPEPKYFVTWDVRQGSRTKTPQTKTPGHKPLDKNPLDKNPPCQKPPRQKNPRQNILFRNFITFVFRMSYRKEISIWFLAVKYIRHGSIK